VCLISATSGLSALYRPLTVTAAKQQLITPRATLAARLPSAALADK